MIIGKYKFEDAWSKGVDGSYYRLADKMNKTDPILKDRPASAIIYRIPSKPDYYYIHIQDSDLFDAFKSITSIDGSYRFNSAEEAIEMFDIFLNKYDNLKAFL
jgi:hypothetical protein